MNIEVDSNRPGSRTKNSVSRETEVRFRCPHCQKLYCTTQDVFEGSAPEFDCAGCEKPFLLKPQSDQFGLYKTEFIRSARSFETCPKCSALKPPQSDECPSCGVLASRFMQLQQAESPLLHELHQQWKSVMKQFDQDAAHQNFLNFCQRKMALNFAFQRYTDLKKVLGFDATCEKYIQQIELRLEHQLKRPADEGGAATVQPRFAISGLQWFFITLGTLGMIALVYNKFIPTFPNFNGLVMMLTVLSFGVGLFAKSNRPDFSS